MRYPQEIMGITLLEVEHAGESRRVFARDRRAYREIGEFTQGPLTRQVYGTPFHYHAVHLAGELPRRFTCFFEQREPYLSDFMDELDASGVHYAYLDVGSSGHVAYRPA